MFLRSKTRKKDGKEHRYWSVVENRRVADGRVVQRQVLYLGEINDAQQAAWCRSIAVFDEDRAAAAQMALFPEDRPAPELACEVVQVKLSRLQLRHPRQWGACWLACELWEQLQLDAFWQSRLPPSRKGTRWLNVLKTLVAYRLIDPGSEWRLHRQWYDRSAMGDLLGEDFAIAESHTLYRCLDRLLAHQRALFSYLQERWRDLFEARFEVLLYDLTSTYFECDPPEYGKRKHGYSRDHRPDCVQVVIALIVTPDGFPLAYEVLPGNTLDKQTLKDFLAKIETQYGKAERVWVMDRGIPTEETLALMRDADPPVRYLVGTPKGRLTELEKSFLAKPWANVREQVTVKLLNKDGETYVLARSAGRRDKEQAMRRRRLKRLWRRLKVLQGQDPSRDQLLLKLGAAKKEAGRAYGLVKVRLPAPDQGVSPDTFAFALDRKKLRQVRRREGRYLLRSNLPGEDPAQLWRWYIQLTEVEQAFKELKGDLGIRPIYHQRDERIEAHIFLAFLAYCLQVTLKARLRPLAPGLTPRAALDNLAAIHMVDVHLPTTDGRTLILSRYTEPEQEQRILLDRLRLTLPEQPPPRITSTLQARGAKPSL
ncbi:MAG TPA: IS1634 family transposase [Chromatiaceae bacterium]|nr:IS1634 family transposase [Chromatiaceae bacterium]